MRRLYLGQAIKRTEPFFCNWCTGSIIGLYLCLSTYTGTSSIPQILLSVAEWFMGSFGHSNGGWIYWDNALSTNRSEFPKLNPTRLAYRHCLYIIFGCKQYYLVRGALLQCEYIELFTTKCKKHTHMYRSYKYIYETKVHYMQCKAI